MCQAELMCQVIRPDWCWCWGSCCSQSQCSLWSPRHFWAPPWRRSCWSSPPRPGWGCERDSGRPPRSRWWRPGWPGGPSCPSGCLRGCRRARGRGPPQPASLSGTRGRSLELHRCCLDREETDELKAEDRGEWKSFLQGFNLKCCGHA